VGNLEAILKKKIKQMGAERQVEAAGVVEAAQKEIAKYIPEEDFEVISFNRGTLKVRVRSAVAANEMSIVKNKLMSEFVKNLKIIL
jgi:hypothetical protein